MSGPLQYFSGLPVEHRLVVYFLSPTIDPVPISSLAVLGGIGGGELIVPTHAFSDAPPLDVIFVPGGANTAYVIDDARYTTFIFDRLPKAMYLFSVCTGAALAARSGVLDGRKATANKLLLDWIRTEGPRVDWVRQARWIVDGNLWSSSGVEAGTDMANAFVAAVYGPAVAEEISKALEYTPQVDSTVDLFAAAYGDHDGPPAPPADEAALAERLSIAVKNLFPSSAPPLPNPPRSRAIGVLLYPGFNPLDIAGFLSYPHLANILSVPTNIYLVAHSLDAVAAGHNGAPDGYKLLPTHTFADPPSLDVLLIPGTSKVGPFPNEAEIVQYLRGAYPSVELLVTISTGSVLLAKTGLLDGKRATTAPKSLWKEGTTHDGVSKVIWVDDARWVRSDNIFTASGSSASLDVGYAVTADIYGEWIANTCAVAMEYLPHSEQSRDVR